MSPDDWQSGFVAWSVLLGGSVDEAMTALGDVATPGARQAAEQLARTSSEARARSLARSVIAIVSPLDAPDGP